MSDTEREPGCAWPIGYGAVEKRYNGKCSCGRAVSLLACAVKLSRAPWRAYQASESGRFYCEEAGCWIRVPCACGERIVFAKPVHGKRNDTVRCDARCTGAKGHSCECSCGGRNHGADASI